MKNKNIFFCIILLSIFLSSCFKEFDADSYRPAYTVGGFTSTKEISPSNLIAYWAFDKSLVDSVSGTAATNSGTSFTGGIKQQGIQGADNSYLLFNPGQTITGMTSFTISYWVNSPVNDKGIVGLVNLSNTSGFWGNIDMFFENGSTQNAAKFRAHIQNGAKDTWIAKDDLPGVFGTWTSFALSYNEATSTFKLYVNGIPQATQVVDGFGPINFANTGPMVFGTVHFQTDPSLTTSTGKQDWASYLVGQLDEVRMYNKALTDDEVNALVKLEGRGK